MKGEYMAELTQDIDRQIKSIAFKLTSNYDDRQDSIQEGRIRVIEMPDGFTSSYYVSAAKWRIRDYLKKTRLNRGDTEERTIEHIGESFESTFDADDFQNSRSFSGNDTVTDRGKKRETNFNYDDHNYGKHLSENDYINQKWLDGHDFGGK
jgi:DNA-directed RNA polymerase specialized sigma24 family protein